MARLLRSGRNILGMLLVAYLVALAVFELREREPSFESIPDNPFAAEMPPGFLWGAATSALRSDFVLRYDRRRTSRMLP